MIKFIKSYTVDNKHRIMFDQNNGDLELNFQFRTQVIYHILNDGISAPDVLIRDLLIIESQFAMITQGVCDELSELANLLLSQTGIKYIDDYFYAKEQSFDTSNRIIPYGLPITYLDNIINQLKIRLQTTADPMAVKNYIEYFLSYRQTNK